MINYHWYHQIESITTCHAMDISCIENTHFLKHRINHHMPTETFTVCRFRPNPRNLRPLAAGRGPWAGKARTWGISKKWKGGVSLMYLKLIPIRDTYPVGNILTF